jgi:hypothetical protein
LTGSAVAGEAKPEASPVVEIVPPSADDEAGVSPDDRRLLIVSYPRRRTIHAVLAVHLDEEWLLLDNLTMVMVNSLEATQYQPLIALDSDATTTFAAGSPAPQEAPAAIQNISGLPKGLPSRSAAR